MKRKREYISEDSMSYRLDRFTLRISLMLIALFASLMLNAQTGKTTVTGTVVDGAGEPLIGASVVEKGTTNGTMTDLDGKFSLPVPSTGTVMVSFLGFHSQEIAVKGKTTIDVKLLEDAGLLDEVVVTALGMKREAKALGYAMTELKGDDLNSNLINPVSALQGKAAGMQINGSDGGLFGSTKVLIRGVSTLKGNNQPIYVVDGAILDNGTHDKSADWDSNSADWGNELKNLNSNDFETVSILKGSAATALYGSRGLNGAIVITTKSGKGQQGFGVSFNQSLGFQKVNTLPNLQMEFGNGAIAASTITNRANAWDTREFTMNNGKKSFRNYGLRYWGPRYDGSEVEGYDGRMVPYSANKNYYEDFYKTGFTSNTNVVVRGGNDKTNFYNSLGYYYAEGILGNNEFSRISNMFKASHKVSDRVTVNAGFTFGISKPKNPELNIGENIVTNGIGPLFDTKYYQHRYKGDNHTGLANANYGDTNAESPYKTSFWELYENSSVRRETTVRPTLDVDVKILDWLNFKAEANMNYYFWNQEDKFPGKGYMNEGSGNGDGGQYRVREEEKKQQTVAGTFTLNHKFGDFDLGGFVRGEFFNQSGKYISSNTEGGLSIPLSYYLGHGKEPLSSESKIVDRKRMMSVAFAANIGWKNQLLV